MYLTVDSLKKNEIKPFYFGLGFIQCKLNNIERYHFYHPDLTVTIPKESIHDHRYDFTSLVLKGSVIHNTYSYILDTNGAYEKLKVSCNPNDLLNYDLKENKPLRCKVKLTGTYTLSKGSYYRFINKEFHNIETSYAITYIKRESTIYKYANVIKPFNTP